MHPISLTYPEFRMLLKGHRSFTVNTTNIQTVFFKMCIILCNYVQWLYAFGLVSTEQIDISILRQAINISTKQLFSITIFLKCCLNIQMRHYLFKYACNCIQSRTEICTLDKARLKLVSCLLM